MSARKRAATQPLDSPSTANRPRIDRVVIDVGGTCFTTSASTLTGSSTYFQHLFSGVWRDEHQECFIDRDPESFAILLNYMRNGLIELPEPNPVLSRRVLVDAEFLGIDGLLQVVKARAHRHLHPESQETDDDAAALFDSEHGTLADAIQSGVLPARFHAPVPPEPKPKIVQLLPAPKGTMVHIVRETDETDEEESQLLGVDCFALVENPQPWACESDSDEPCFSHLDAYVTTNEFNGPTLASEVYGAETSFFQFRQSAEEKSVQDIMVLPGNMNFYSELWKDRNDHSKGTFHKRVPMVRRVVKDDAVFFEPVELRPGPVSRKLIDLKPMSSWNNFSKFVDNIPTE